MICHPLARLATANLSTKIEVFISAHNKDTKRDTKSGKLEKFGVVRGRSMH